MGIEPAKVENSARHAFYTFGKMPGIFLSAAYILLFLFLMGKIRLFANSNTRLIIFRILFLLKIIAGIGLYLIYTEYYPDRKFADIFRYYDDSAVIHNTLFTHPYDYFRMVTGIDGNSPPLYEYYNVMNNWFNTDLVFNDSRTMIRINVLMRLFSFGYFYPHMIFFAFLSMTGLTALYRVFERNSPGKEFLWILIVFLMPSVLLWTSGVIKEAFLMFSAGLFIYATDRFLNGDTRLKVWLLFLVAAILLLLIKAYMFFAILPGVVTWYVLKKHPRHKILLFITVHAVLLFLMFKISSLITPYTIPEMLASKQQEFYRVAELENAGSVIEIPRLQPEFFSVLKNSVPAFFNTLLRPFPADIHNILMWSAFLENLLLLLFVITGLYFHLKIKGPLPSVFFATVSIAVLIYMLAGIVTPIIGALVRYKVPAIPFLLYAVSIKTQLKIPESVHKFICK